MPAKSKFGNCNGYSLVELMIVVSLITILTVAVYAGSRTFSQDQTLIKSVSDIQSLVRLAQTNSTAGAICNTVAPSSWAVTFNPDSTSLGLVCNGSVVIKTLNLEATQVASVLGSNCPSASALPVSVNFASVFGKVSFVGTDVCLGRSSSLTVTLQNVKNSSTRVLRINSGGSIDVL